MADSANQGNRKQRGAVTAILVVGGLVIVALVGVIVALVMNLKRGETETYSDIPQQRAVVINEENVEEVLEEIASEPAVTPGYYEVSMNTTWNFPDGVSPARDAYVENVPGNTNDVYFDITLRGTDTVIYESPVIPRGGYLDDVTLTENLSAGEYDCVMTYHLVDEQQRTLSTLNMAMTIVIEN
jgi:hypothetical protein